MQISSGWQDLLTGFRRIDIPYTYAIFDLKTRFRASILGPVWITIHTLVFTITLGFVFSTVFNTDISEYLPYLSCGLMIWTLISTLLLESTNLFTMNASYVKNVDLPLSTYILRLILKNLLIMLFHLPITVGVLVYFNKIADVHWITFLVNYSILVVILGNGVLFVSVLSARFVDIEPIAQAVLQVVFLATPIIWSVETMSGRAKFIELNPAYHLVEFVRAPLLGQEIADNTILAIVIIGLFSTLVAFYTYSKFYRKIAYWVQ